MTLTDDDRTFIQLYPYLEEQYLRVRANDTSSRMAQLIVLRRPPGQTQIPSVEGGELVSSKEMAQEKRRGMKDEIIRRKKEKKGEDFISYLDRTGRRDVIHEIRKKKET